MTASKCLSFLTAEVLYFVWMERHRSKVFAFSILRLSSRRGLRNGSPGEDYRNHS